jgi:hypothetical protein
MEVDPGEVALDYFERDRAQIGGKLQGQPCVVARLKKGEGGNSYPPREQGLNLLDGLGGSGGAGP